MTPRYRTVRPPSFYAPLSQVELDVLSVLHVDSFMSAADIARALGQGMSWKLRTALARLRGLGRVDIPARGRGYRLVRCCSGPEEARERRPPRPPAGSVTPAQQAVLDVMTPSIAYTVPQLAARLGRCLPWTLQGTLAHLERKRLIVRARGARTFVLAPPPPTD